MQHSEESSLGELVLNDYNISDRPPVRLTGDFLFDRNNKVIEELAYDLFDTDGSAPGVADFLKKLEKHRLEVEEEERRQREIWGDHPPLPDVPPSGRVMPVVERFAQAAIDRSSNGQALVSIMFCHPRSIVFRDLLNEYAYLNQRSGTNWDLIFAGYVSRSNPINLIAPRLTGVPIWKFLPEVFDRIRRTVSQDHAEALRGDVPSGLTPWRYSGMPELVSVMAYSEDITEGGCTRTAAKIDWASLRAVRLTAPNGNYLSQNLAMVVETLSDWRELSESAEPGRAFRELAPGEVPSTTASVEILKPLLNAAAAAIAGGVAGNAAYDLLKKIMGM